MSAEIYRELQGVTRDVLKEFTQGTITYMHSTPGAGPADDPGPATLTPYPYDGVARGVKFKFIDGTTIIASDLQTTMPAIDVEPDIKGHVIADSIRYKIIRVDRIPSIGDVVAYRLFIRK